jgi:succinate-semialdehyde dehydrogenase/glutarate-semialdehyde dehydrogenase
MSSKKTCIESIDPATGEVLGSVTNSSRKDVEWAVENAGKAFLKWKETSFEERANVMRKARSIIIDRKEELIELIVKETGKPRLEALLHDLHFSLDDLAYYEMSTEKLLREEKVNLGIAYRGQKNRVVFEPAGVVAIINPWNFPFLLTFRSLIPALMAGNSVILKPSEHTPLCGLKIGEVMKDAGLPEGVFTVLTGDGITGQYLVESGVDRVVFTGSVETGKKVMVEASKRLIPVVLELGGKDPAIICSDADLEWTTSGIVWSGLLFTGQSCSSIERIYVMEDIADEFTRMIVEKTKKLKVGNGLDPETDIGPMIASFQIKNVLKHLKDAKKKGAKILIGGKRIGNEESLFFEPTILTDVNHDMLVMKKETFGPVLCIMRVKSLEEAVRLANDTEYGLTASIWTKDLEKGKRIANEIQAGCISLNNRAIEVKTMPWGGIKKSGIGKTSSRYGMMNFVNIKCITIDGRNKEMEDWWYPYTGDKDRFFNEVIPDLHSDELSKVIKAGLKFIRGMRTKK